MSMVACQDCELINMQLFSHRGNKKCSYCHGKGYTYEIGDIAANLLRTKGPESRTKCTVCDGSGKCQTCDGTGLVDSNATPKASSGDGGGRGGGGFGGDFGLNIFFSREVIGLALLVIGFFIVKDWLNEHATKTDVYSYADVRVPKDTRLYPNEDKIKGDLIGTKVGDIYLGSFVRFNLNEAHIYNDALYRRIDVLVPKDTEGNYYELSIDLRYNFRNNQFVLAGVSPYLPHIKTKEQLIPQEGELMSSISDSAYLLWPEMRPEVQSVKIVTDNFPSEDLDLTIEGVVENLDSRVQSNYRIRTKYKYIPSSGWALISVHKLDLPEYAGSPIQQESNFLQGDIGLKIKILHGPDVVVDIDGTRSEISEGKELNVSEIDLGHHKLEIYSLGSDNTLTFVREINFTIVRKERTEIEYDFAKNSAIIK